MVVTPFIYGGMLYYMFKRIKKALTEREDTLFLLSFSLPMILFFSLVGLISWVKVNWLAPAYLTGVALFFGELLKNESRKYFRLSVLTCLVLGLVLFVQLSFSPIAASGEMMTVAGWQALTEKVEQEMQTLPEPDKAFIFGWEYKVPSVLSFYLPGQPDNYGNDVLGKPLLQYQYWFDPDPLIGKDALFVVDKRQKFVPPGTTKRQWWDMDIPHRREVVVDYLGKFFDDVEWTGDFLPEYRGKQITRFSIYRCHNYKGPNPVSP